MMTYKLSESILAVNNTPGISLEKVELSGINKGGILRILGGKL